MPPPAIALVNADRDPSRRVVQDSPSDVHHHRALKKAFESEGETLAFVLFCDEPEKRLELVQAILRHPRHYLRPVFLGDPANEQLSALVDGTFTSWEETRDRAAEIDQMIKVLPDSADAADHDERLLRYLFVRSDARIRPVLSYASWRIYSYPLLEAFNPAAGMSATWLNSLRNRGFVSDRELIDRIRLCPSCGSSHLNYLDRCPSCSKIGIEQSDFFHCFTCGNVAPEKSFMAGGTMKCPKCAAVLRHIGADYDRALEHYRCRDCSSIFSEPEVVAKCYECNFSGDTDKLQPLNVADLGISEEGRLAVRSGRLRDVYALLDNLNFVTPQYFRSSLDWLVELWHRHKAVHFTVMLIGLENVRQLVVDSGRFEAMLAVEELSRRLRNELRTTDIAARIEENRIGFILPFTPPENIGIVVSRLRGLQNTRVSEGKASIDLRHAVYSVPKDLTQGDRADSILARLTTGLVEDA